jgi:NitT/TauT family transport system substrate-binding protein
MRKLFKLFVVTLIFAVIAAGCGSAANEGAKPKEKSAEGKDGLKKVTIQIDGAAVPYYAPLYVAKEKGFFEEEGLEVEFLYAAAADIVKNVASGNVELGFPNGDSVIAAVAQDIPVKVVHTTYQNGLGATIFKKDSGIKKPADLKDKTVAVTSYGSPNYIQLQVLLENSGLSLRDVNVKIVGTGSIVNALVDDQVDAITFSMLRTVEMRNQGVEVDEFRSDEFLPSHGNVLIAGDDYLADNKETVKGFTNALNKGLQFIIDGGIDEAVSLSVEKYAPSFAGREKVVTEILNDIFIPYLWQSDYTEKNGLGASNMEKWQNTIDELKRFEVIGKELKAEDVVVEKLN